MSKTEGEYELVLGNRQLLSAFFIIVILFGVFFTMGYVVGRNSTPGVAASSVGTPVQRPENAATSTPAQTAPPQSSALPKEETKEPAPVETKTAESKPVETKPVETKPVEAAPPPQPEKPKAKAEAPARHVAPKSPASSAGAVAVNPGPGSMYLQVMAVEQPQAGVVRDTLKQKGFTAVLEQSPIPNKFRVLVGPYPDTGSLGKAKAQLENAGFKPFVRK